MSSMRSLNPQRWLDAYTEPHASLYTFSHCMAMADLNADGDYKLLVADLGTGATNMKLKVYKGTSLMTENTLIDIPTGVVSFYMDTNEPRIPAIAVASGSNVFVYKNMRPYFKFSLPSTEVNQLERELWTNVSNRSMEVEVLHEMLESVRDEIGFSALTARSQRFLVITDRAGQKEFVDKYRDVEIKKQAIITCIATLNKNTSDPEAVSCLVLGTESGDIYFLDPQAFTILETVSIYEGREAVVPVHMTASGLYDVDYRIVTACRDGSINVCRRGYTQAKTVVRLSSQCVAMAITDTNNIVVATMEQTIHCYSKSGKKQWLVKVPGSVMAMTTVSLPHQGLTLVAVALREGTVQFYSGRDVVDVMTASDTIAAMRFGRFGQEEHSLILITVGGCLMVKILKRTAQFSEQAVGPGLVPSQQIKFSIPKKTKLFVEQTMRERETCAAMHRSFQLDLFRLRLNTARACAQALQSGSNPLSRDITQPLKMSAQVLGLGPVFKIRVTLENMSAANPSTDLAITFHFDEKAYAVDKPFIQVPMLVPGLTYHFEAMVRCVSEMGVSDQVRIFVVKPDTTQPLLAALIDMPVCDMLNVM